MFLNADQIFCHLIGDYLLQNDWMAENKTKKITVTTVHGIVYSLPFWFYGLNLNQWLILVSTHIVIDRFRLARYIIWLRNFFSPRWIMSENTKIRNLPWSECNELGFLPGKPIWLTTWLYIITDNVFHLFINASILKFII